MRIRREKTIRKTLSFYKLHGGSRFESPYKILCDGNLIVAAFRFKVKIMERLRKLFQGETFQLYVTKSVKDEIQELSSQLSNEHAELFQNALSFINKECTTLEEIPQEKPSKKLLKNLKRMNQVSNDIYSLASMDENSHGYFIATQDEELRSLLRNKSIVPLLYINKTGVLLLEQPSTSSHKLVQINERKKLLT